ncbi:MAG: hypothetical protein WBR26_24790 [Candidatus Acidiferrum sp.]
MSRKLGALALVLGILVCSLGLKTALSSSSHSGSTVMMANGPDPFPQPPKP